MSILSYQELPDQTEGDNAGDKGRKERGKENGLFFFLFSTQSWVEKAERTGQ
jgi:hypothetical protein